MGPPPGPDPREMIAQLTRRLRSDYGPLIRQVQNRRKLIEQSWLDNLDSYKGIHRKQGFHGEWFNHFLPASRRNIERFITRARQQLFPSPEFFEVYPLAMNNPTLGQFAEQWKTYLALARHAPDRAPERGEPGAALDAAVSARHREVVAEVAAGLGRPRDLAHRARRRPVLASTSGPRPRRAPRTRRSRWRPRSCPGPSTPPCSSPGRPAPRRWARRSTRVISSAPSGRTT